MFGSPIEFRVGWSPRFESDRSGRGWKKPPMQASGTDKRGLLLFRWILNLGAIPQNFAMIVCFGRLQNFAMVVIRNDRLLVIACLLPSFLLLLDTTVIPLEGMLTLYSSHPWRKFSLWGSESSWSGILLHIRWYSVTDCVRARRLRFSVMAKFNTS